MSDNPLTLERARRRHGRPSDFGGPGVVYFVCPRGSVCAQHLDWTAARADVLRWLEDGTPVTAFRDAERVYDSARDGGELPAEEPGR